MTRTLPPPGPEGHFFFGNLREFSSDPPGFLTECARRHGDVVSFRLLNRRFCLLSRPDLVEAVLVTQNRNFIKPIGLRGNRRLFGNGLLISEGDFWLRQRRLAQPVFHRERIATYGEGMVACSKNALAGWSEGETRDVHADMMGLTLDIVAKVLFEAKVGDVAADIGAALDVIMEENEGPRLLFPVLKNVPTPGSLRFERAVRRLEAITYAMIRQGRQAGAESGNLLSMLLHARGEDGSQMTDQQVRDEVITLLLAGHETTALTLSWIWHLLAQHPDEDDKLMAELSRVLGGRPPKVGDLPDLPFLDMVVKEAMRLYPPAWWIGREAVADCEIGGFEVPAGATVTMSQWVIQRDPRYFEAADEFRPERWANGFAARLPAYAYFPFGGGPRICIGSSFARMEAALLLATIAQEFKFAHVPGHPVEPLASITLRPRHGLWMRLARR